MYKYVVVQEKEMEVVAICKYMAVEVEGIEGGLVTCRHKVVVEMVSAVIAMEREGWWRLVEYNKGGERDGGSGDD